MGRNTENPQSIVTESSDLTYLAHISLLKTVLIPFLVNMHTNLQNTCTLEYIPTSFPDHWINH